MTWCGQIHEYKDMTQFEFIHLLSYLPAHMCGMQIHSALQKHSLLGWTFPGWHFKPTHTQDIGQGDIG